MIVVIASLCGITEMVSLFSLFALTAAMNLFGLMMEMHNQTTAKTNWMAFILGSVVGVVPWIGIMLYFVRATPSPPVFVYAVVISLIFLYALFPLNMWLQYAKKGLWKNYIWGEYGYTFSQPDCEISVSVAGVCGDVELAGADALKAMPCSEYHLMPGAGAPGYPSGLLVSSIARAGAHLSRCNSNTPA